MPRRRPVELNISHERWLVSYADFITLLFGFFVVMYSVSQVNESKYRVLSDTLLSAFNMQAEKSFDPLHIAEQGSENNRVVSQEPTATGEMPGNGAFEKSVDLPHLREEFAQEFSDLIDDELVQVRSNEFWLQIELQDSILFDSGRAQPSPQAQTIFEDVASLLKGFTNPVQVEGFTDNIPISTAAFPSNWELSSARASAIVKLLVAGGVDPGRLSAVGYGEHRPIADNSTEAGRRQNRRVALMISRERIERPKVQGAEQIETAIASSAPEVSQPYPQPGLEEATVDAAGGQDLPLDTPLQQGGTPSDTTIGDILQPVSEPPPAPPEPQVKTRVGDIEAVELKGGGLLFSSDPDLPRSNN